MNHIINYKTNLTHINGEKVTYLDTILTTRYKISIIQLIEIAGLRLAEFIQSKTNKNTKIYFFIGSGNNGGDGLVAARFLNSWNISVEIFLIKDKSKYSKMSLTQLSTLSKLKIPINLFNNNLKHKISSNHIIVDALLGASLKSKPNKKMQDIFETINKMNTTKISVDVPSGLNCKTGKLYKYHIKPNYILSFIAPKKGFKRIVDSKIYIADIGINIKNILKNNKISFL